MEKFDDEIDEIISKFEFNVFFNNDHQQDVIQSNRKRCLNSFVVQEHIHFILLFLEIQLRIFSNFFYSLSRFSPERKEREMFLDIAFDFIKRFVVYSMYNINFDYLSILFNEIEYDQFKFLKVINKKYKEELDKKYAD